MNSLTVDFERLRTDIEELSEIGRSTDHGLHRVAFSEEWKQACRWLTKKLVKAKLHASTDSALNVIGLLPAENGEKPLPSVATGSHLDSVPGGGHLDGALGVVVGLECLRRLRELEIPLKRPLELIAFTDEEGRFGGMFGSQAIAGQLTPEMIMNAVDSTGLKLTEALSQSGIEPLHALRAQRPNKSLHCFVELHIEQGPVLDAKGLHIGAVTGIVGLRRWHARLIGQANHAGTTPMHMRIDAFQGLAEIARNIDGVIEENGGPHSTITIGRVDLSPGAANVIPGLAEFSIDMRDVDEGQLNGLAQSFREMASRVARERNLMFEFESISELPPISCTSKIVDLVEEVARGLDQEALRLPSGAAHDTQMMHAITDVGMVFVPSSGGRSHSAAEWTSWESIELGANTLLNVLCRLAQEP